MSERLYFDGPLTVTKSDWLTDWWMIERAEHDGSHGIRWEGNSGHFYHSGRVSDADVEGRGP